MRILSLYDPEEIVDESLHRNPELNRRNEAYARILNNLLAEGAIIYMTSITLWSDLAETSEPYIRETPRVVETFQRALAKPISKADMVTYQTDNLFRILCDVFDCHRYRDPEYAQQELTLQELRESQKKAQEYEEACRTRLGNSQQLIGYINNEASLESTIITHIGSDIPLPAECNQVRQYCLTSPYTALIQGTGWELLGLVPYREGIGELAPWWELYNIFRLAADICIGIESLLEKVAWKQEEQNITMFTTQPPETGECYRLAEEIFPLI